MKNSPTQFVFHWCLLIIKELHCNIPRCQPKSRPSIRFLLCRSQRVRISSKRIWLLFPSTQTLGGRHTVPPLSTSALSSWLAGQELSRESSTEDGEHAASVQRANSLVCSQAAPETYGTCHFIIKIIKLYFWGSRVECLTGRWGTDSVSMCQLDKTGSSSAPDNLQ